MGDITLIEGKDAFGEGPAVQVVFGGGPAMQLGEEYNWALSAWLGVGVSYRVNNLFPARENRSLFELNVAVQPVVTTIEDSRFLLAGFFEARFPLVPFLFAWFLGETSWFEWGPLGVRYYFVWPNKLPGGPGQWDVGWDVELLNFDIDRATARNREAGHLLDKEIRIRLGYFNQQYLMGSEGSGRSWVLAAEFAWGHSTYFGDF
jgi:hypothetical protein